MDDFSCEGNQRPPREFADGTTKPCHSLYFVSPIFSLFSLTLYPGGKSASSSSSVSGLLRSSISCKQWLLELPYPLVATVYLLHPPDVHLLRRHGHHRLRRRLHAHRKLTDGRRAAWREESRYRHPPHSCAQSYRTGCHLRRLAAGVLRRKMRWRRGSNLDVTKMIRNCP